MAPVEEDEDNKTTEAPRGLPQPGLRQMLLQSVPVATFIGKSNTFQLKQDLYSGALDQKYCTCLFKKPESDTHERHCGSLQ